MKIDQKLLKIMGMAAGVILILIIIIALISSCSKNKKYTLEDLENKLITLSKKYYEQNKSSLPKDGEETSLTTEYFITNGYIKSLNLTTGNTCSGEIIVTNNNGYYLYTPQLSCGSDIKTITLYEKLTEESNIVTIGEGLYSYENAYIYRGEKINNYLKINDKLWQIIKINSDKSIRVIETKKSDLSPWDNRYNLEKKSNTGINDFVANNINSRIKNKLEDLYNNEQKFNKDIKVYFTKQDLCVGKRSEIDDINDGSIECSEIIEDQIFGLIQANEYVLASLDQNCSHISSISCINYNYLARLDSSTWTLTADKDTSYKAYRLDYGLSLSNTSNTSGVAIVVHLSKNILYKSGTGTLNDPYIIK